jgi:hypothetical protein
MHKLWVIRGRPFKIALFFHSFSYFCKTTTQSILVIPMKVSSLSHPMRKYQSNKFAQYLEQKSPWQLFLIFGILNYMVYKR